MSDTDQIRAEAERLADVPAGMVRVGEWLAGECPDGGVRCVPTNPETRGILAALMMAIGDAWQESGAANNLTWGMQVPGVGFVDIVMQLRDHPTPSEQRDALKATIGECVREIASHFSGSDEPFCLRASEDGCELGDGCDAGCPLVRLREAAGIKDTEERSE